MKNKISGFIKAEYLAANARDDVRLMKKLEKIYGKKLKKLVYISIDGPDDFCIIDDSPGWMKQGVPYPSLAKPVRSKRY